MAGFVLTDPAAGLRQPVPIHKSGDDHELEVHVDDPVKARAEQVLLSEIDWLFGFHVRAPYAELPAGPYSGGINGILLQ